MVAIATAMMEEGTLTLPFLVGYLMGIVVPIVVYAGVIIFVVAGAYRIYTGKDLANLATLVWAIWTLVAVVNFFGNLQAQKQRKEKSFSRIAGQQMYAPYTNWEQKNTAGSQGKQTAVLTLQARFSANFKKLDLELANKVATFQIPAIFNPAFLKHKSRFPSAIEQFKNYGKLFYDYNKERMEMLLQMKREIEQLDISQKEKMQSIQEFTYTYEIDADLSKKYYDIVIKVAQLGNEYLRFLSQTQYQVSGTQIKFETDSDSEKQMSYLQAFKNLSKQEVAAQRELADSRKKRMAYLTELSN